MKGELREFLKIVIIVLIFLTALLTYFGTKIIKLIKPGEAGVYYSVMLGGTVTDWVYREGIHFKFPWDRLYLYNIRIQKESVKMKALTDKGLNIDIIGSVNYYPLIDKLGIIHKTVGPDYFSKLVSPFLYSEILRHIGDYDAEELYFTKRQMIQEKVFIGLKTRLEPFGIIISKVLIHKIVLPQKLRLAINEKMAQKQAYHQYDYLITRARAEAQRKKIEAQGISLYQSIISKTVNEQILKWKGVKITKQMALSPNSKTIVIGRKYLKNSNQDIPLILNVPAPENHDINTKEVFNRPGSDLNDESMQDLGPYNPFLLNFKEKSDERKRN